MFAFECSINRDSLYTHIQHSKAKISKVDYSSKAKGSNVRDLLQLIGTVQLQCKWTHSSAAVQLYSTVYQVCARALSSSKISILTELRTKF